MSDYADVLLDVRGPGTPVEGAPGRVAFESVVQVDGSGERRGTIELDESTLDITRPLEYGATLGAALATPALTAALVEARTLASGCVRLRLQIDERADALHRLRWELLRLPSTDGDAVTAIADRTPLSRYLPLAEQDRTPPADRQFTVLVAFANPLGLPDGMEIAVEQEIAALVDEFDSLKMKELPRLRVLLMPGRTKLTSEATTQAVRDAGWTLVDGATSLRTIQTALQRHGCHGLHLVCHGKTLRNRSELTLEDDATGGQVQVADVQLAAWYHLKLQLLLFQSCRTATPSPNRPPFSHIAGQMLRMGVPAVVAMQDFVAMVDARYFALAFYRSLLRDGLVDVAANRGRAAMAADGHTEGDQPEWNWSIPALYMRLKGGLLWSPDAVREYVVATKRRLTGDATAFSQTLPLKVIEHAEGLRYNPAAGASGSWYGMSARTSELLGADNGATVVLVGPQGSGKTAEARRLFVELAAAYLSAPTATPAAPVLCQLSDLSPWTRSADTDGLFADFHRLLQGDAVPERLAGARFVFLVTQSAQRLGRAARVEALRALRQLLDRCPGSSCLLTYGDTQLTELEPLSRNAHVLVIQPMNRLEILGYLRAREPKLLARLSIRRLDDLATNPWLLEQMREQVHVDGDVALRSRADVLERCVSRMLARFDNTQMPLAAAEKILEAVAWRIQEKRPTEQDAAAAAILPQADAERLITELRGTGEFSIADMRKELTACGVIAQIGDGDVRFPIQSIRAFLAAQYLAKSPQSAALVDNLASTFGRLGRLRYWTETLVIAAALPQFQQRRAELLDSVLTGSSMLEGEQAFLAARLYVEMSQNGAADDPKFDETVRQIIDSLVWRARDVDGRPYDDRRKAVAHLAAMRHPNVVPHLVQIAVDKIRPLNAKDASTAYDYAGIRFLAMDGLWQQVDETLAEVAKRPDAAALQEVIAAWRDMYTNPERSGRMLDILKQDEPYRGPIAAFAFLQCGPEVIERELLPLYWNGLENWDLLWCITEGLAWMDGDWLAAKVIDPAIARLGTSWETAPSRSDRHPMLCFLIRELGDAPHGSPRRTYLEEAFRSGTDVSRTWALRALATLRDGPGTPGPEGCTPRSIAHAILGRDTGMLERLKIDVNWRWRQAAFEVLRDAGDDSSVELIRAIRPSLEEPGLFKLSFHVAEEIYWRLTGGMIQATT